jgi:hypothetical protein
VESNWVLSALWPPIGLLCQPPGDYDGEIGGMIIGSGNWSTRRRPAPMPLCSNANPTCCPDVNPGRRGGKPATNAWATARPSHLFFNEEPDSAVGIERMATGWTNEGSEFRVPVRSRIFSFPRRPDWLWGPPNLWNGYRGSFPRGIAAGAWSWPFTSN